MVICITAGSILIMFSLVVLDENLLSYDSNISLIDVGLYSFGAYFQEPFHVKMRNGKRFIQCLQFFWLLWTFFIMVSWQCDLRAKLMAAEHEPEISSVQQFITQSKRKMYIDVGYQKYVEASHKGFLDSLKYQGRHVIRNGEGADTITKNGGCVIVDMNTMKHLIFQQQLKTGKMTFINCNEFLSYKP
ncbi:uncharacterized protein LOC111702138 [Eurytemora carolleeae]|uniref:uncharacterized protein LOC111702138 n=1 Tax=Eurytemora carolleeae TaxID=1294199 RepID=UPI000C7700DB|nr:uncharacterized protein LOC111702138 [Eurytemora carolleeae]|eukprot:XP_023329485.1 uncharacterized protein LOC111702138 [Eurytemora affinis]